MRDPRNPFRLRASEHIASDSIFLRLFGSGALAIMQRGNPLETNMLLRSAPGGGKTSLLRAFTASALLYLCQHRDEPDYRDLFSSMEQLGAVAKEGPSLLGIMIACSKNYAALEDTPWEEHRRRRLFFALLNCRVVLATLRSAMALKSLSYPGDLHRLTFDIPNDLNDEMQLPPDWAGGGDRLYDWARSIEERISEALDSLDTLPPDAPGHNSLFSFRMVDPSRVLLDGQPLIGRILVMFDDVNRLAPSQRGLLGQALIGERGHVPVWFAERLEALRAEDLLDQGAHDGRDYGQPAWSIEKYWRDYPNRFKKTVESIGEKRARQAQSVDISSLEACLAPSLGGEHDAILQTAAEQLRERLISLHGKSARYRGWIESADASTRGPYQRAITWKVLEILAERDQRRTQLSFDLELSSDDLAKRGDNRVRTAAELMVSREFSLPYYYGYDKVVTLSSSNIEQHLVLGGDLFEEAAAADVIGRPHQLSASRQDAIIRGTAKRWWNDYLRTVPFSAEVRRLVEAIGRFAEEETFKANAPYAPGVTGVAITMVERELLTRADYLEKRPTAKRLSNVIGACIAHNILEVVMDHIQGDERRMVLYLNRLLCVRFNLPLSYGGWRAKHPEDLVDWLQKNKSERLI